MPPLDRMEATLALGLLFACYTDIRWWRIPNVLNLFLILAGLLLNAIYGTVWIAVVGLLFAFAIHFPLWVLGVQKGGDAKLMMGLGALVGWEAMVETTFWKLILMLPVGVAVLAATGNLGNLASALRHVVARAKGEAVAEPPRLTYMPFAPVIAIGWLCALLTDWLEFW